MSRGIEGAVGILVYVSRFRDVHMIRENVIKGKKRTRLIRGQIKIKILYTIASGKHEAFFLINYNI